MNFDRPQFLRRSIEQKLRILASCLSRLRGSRTAELACANYRYFAYRHSDMFPDTFPAAREEISPQFRSASATIQAPGARYSRVGESFLYQATKFNGNLNAPAIFFLASPPPSRRATSSPLAGRHEIQIGLSLRGRTAFLRPTLLQSIPADCPFACLSVILIPRVF